MNDAAINEAQRTLDAIIDQCPPKTDVAAHEAWREQVYAARDKLTTLKLQAPKKPTPQISPNHCTRCGMPKGSKHCECK